MDKEHERKPNTDVFTDCDVGTQFLFPFDTDVSALGHMLGIAWDPKHSTEEFGDFFASL